MKTKILFFALISILVNCHSFAQIITFGFVKNCMSYERSTVTDELTKKHFYVVERTMQKTNNKLLEGATFYCNEKERELGIAEIDILSFIDGSKKITEITFLKGSKHDYIRNYGEIYKQMLTFFNNEKTFKSEKYKTDVTKFSKEKVYYYVYKINDVPTIVISNNKIDEEYF